MQYKCLYGCKKQQKLHTFKMLPIFNTNFYSSVTHIQFQIDNQLINSKQWQFLHCSAQHPLLAEPDQLEKHCIPAFQLEIAYNLDELENGLNFDVGFWNFQYLIVHGHFLNYKTLCLFLHYKPKNLQAMLLKFGFSVSG